MMKKLRYYFYWQGFNAENKKQRGMIKAFSSAVVKIELAKKGVHVKKIKKRQPFFRQNLSQAKQALLFRQLATMLKTGLPLVEAIEFAAQTQINPLMKDLLEDLRNDLIQGLPLFEALGRQASLFNEFDCNLIAAGEKVGKLDLILDKAADYKEKIAAITKKIKKILAYPVIVLFVTAVVTWALLIFVVPQFEALFASFGAKLPALTRLILYLSNYLTNNFYFLILITASLIYGYKLAINRNTYCSMIHDQLLLNLPLLGSLITKAIIIRFTATLAISVSAGLPLLESLSASINLMSNKIYLKAIELIQSELLTGQPLYLALEKTKLFPNLVVQLIAIGEKSGTLESMLSKITMLYEEEFNSSLDFLIHLLEPILMAILGILVGVLVIAMYLPIFKLGSVI